MMMKIANMMRKLRKDEKGFTLIELMVVIAVLGILAALIIPQFANVNIKAQTANASSTASAVASATAMFWAERGTVPTDASADLGQYMSNIDTILLDYDIAFDSPAAGSVELTGIPTGPNKVPDTIIVSAKYK